MDTCSSCGQAPEFVCSCQFLPLCLDCIKPHMQQAPNDTHFMSPYIKTNQRPVDFAGVKNLVDRMETMSPYIDSETEFLNQIK